MEQADNTKAEKENREELRSYMREVLCSGMEIEELLAVCMSAYNDILCKEKENA